MDSFDYQKAREFQEQKERTRRKQIERRLATAMSDADAIVKTIVRKYHPTRIYQWGSLVDTDLFAEYSDIDIAVEGIADAEEYFRLLGDVWKMTDLPLDIVQLEKIEPEFRQQIVQYGKLVYAAE
jgi:predicted nucleotidyltransferase